MTITGPGTWEQDRKIEFNGNTMVGPDVTIKNNFGGGNLAAGSNWDPQSRLWGTNNGGVWSGGGTIGYLKATGPANAWTNNGTFTIANDVNINLGGGLNMAGGVTQAMFVGGNFTDQNTTGDYTDGKLEFNGSAATQLINIHRPLQSTIRVTGAAGAKLVNDFDGAASNGTNPHESLLIGGDLDLNGFDLSTNQLVVGGSQNITWGAAADSSVIDVGNGLGNINTFNVTIEDTSLIGGGAYGSGDFVLFDYSGITKGIYTPTLGTVDLPTGWSSAGTLLDNGTTLSGSQTVEINGVTFDIADLTDPGAGFTKVQYSETAPLAVSFGTSPQQSWDIEFGGTLAGGSTVDVTLTYDGDGIIGAESDLEIWRDGVGILPKINHVLSTTNGARRGSITVRTDGFSDFALVEGGVLPVLGDINGDGFVDVADLALIGAQWGTDGTGNLFNADISPPPTGDGVVDIGDLALVGANWDPAGTGPSLGGAAIPLPSAAAIGCTLLGAIGLTRRRVR